MGRCTASVSIGRSFAEHVAAAGLELVRVDHQNDTDGQSAIYLRSAAA